LGESAEVVHQENFHATHLQHLVGIIPDSRVMRGFFVPMTPHYVHRFISGRKPRKKPAKTRPFQARSGRFTSFHPAS